MGSIAVPESGRVYVDSQVIIYSVERHPQYAPRLRGMWSAMARGQVEVVTSDLALMEALIVPSRNGDNALIADFERLLFDPNLRLLPISHGILREAALLRAQHRSLRTPDALHAATGRLSGCSSFLTNDVALAKLPGFNFILVDQLADPPPAQQKSAP